MSILVESLRRLYSTPVVGKDKIDTLFNRGVITNDERDYILNL